MRNSNLEDSSRRKFFKTFAATAVAGSFLYLPRPCRKLMAEAWESGQDVTVKNDEGILEKLVAPCGLFCGACPMYLATQEGNQQRLDSLVKQFSAGKMQMKLDDLLCDGCIGGGRVASFCRRCGLRSCAESKENVTRCSDCPDFPCPRITNFNNDGMLHHAEVIENLSRLREKGLHAWARFEGERWCCPGCREKLSWYDAACRKCGRKRPETLFRLKQA